MAKRSDMRSATGWAVLACLALVAWPGSARADAWSERSSSCIKAFGTPDKSDEKTLMMCADAFCSDARMFAISSGDKSAIEKGLRFMYDKGSDPAAALAREGLVRLDVIVAPRAATATAQGTASAEPAARKRYDPPEANAANRKAAEALAKAGVKLLSKQKYPAGTAQLEKALAKDPRSEFVLYNLACGEANMDDRHKDCLEHLQDLADLDTDQSAERLIMARKDKDFAPMRGEPDFKRITGYLRIQVINTIGKNGEPAMENIQKLLEKLEQPKADVGAAEKGQENPTILFKPHAKAQTSLLADLLNHPRVRIDPIDFDTKYDLIIRWGAKITMVDGKPKAESVGPETADEAVQKARHKQNQVLAQPEQAINKVNKVVNTPERTYNEGQAMEKRVEGTVKKAEGALKGIEALGGKVKGL